MKLLYGSLAAALFAFGIAPLSAGPVGRVGGAYSSTNYYGYSYTPATPSIPQTTSTPTASQQTLQNAVSTLNPLAASAPGVSGTPSSPTNVMQTSFYYNPYSYGAGFGYSGFYGGAVSYQRVFAVNNFGSAGPAPGSATSSPAFDGGFANSRILTDPSANPEPGSIVLLGSGIGALLYWRRRRKS